MLWQPVVWLMVECLHPLVNLVHPLVQLVHSLVQTFWWLVKGRLLLLLLVEGEKRRPGYWCKQAAVNRLRPVCLARMCLHAACVVSSIFIYQSLVSSIVIS